MERAAAEALAKVRPQLDRLEADAELARSRTKVCSKAATSGGSLLLLPASASAELDRLGRAPRSRWRRRRNLGRRRCGAAYRFLPSPAPPMIGPSPTRPTPTGTPLTRCTLGPPAACSHSAR